MVMGMEFLLTSQYTSVEIFQKVWMLKFCYKFQYAQFSSGTNYKHIIGLVWYKIPKLVAKTNFIITVNILFV